ncbi:MAG: hypothetical protein KBS60_04700, partial [Phascolarctobacterium sp.]|nr:hypothetical protein [Candidatus Phascolarctobacterium caballi]
MISQSGLSIAAEGSLKTDIDKLDVTSDSISDNGDLILTADGTGDVLEKQIKGKGNLTFAGNITTEMGNIATSGTNSVSAGATLTLSDGGTLTKKIDGEGTIKFLEDITTNADNIAISETNIASGKTLTLTGGKTNNLGGDGNIVIAGNVQVNNLNNASGDLTVKTSKVLKLTGDNLSKEITNNGTVILNGDGMKVNKAVNGGTLEIAANTEVNDANYLNADKNIVDNGKTLIFKNGGELKKVVEGAGSLQFDENTTTDVDNIKTTGTNVIAKNKILTLTSDGKDGDTLTAKLAGVDAKITIDGKIKANADDFAISGEYGGVIINEDKELELIGGVLCQNYNQGVIKLNGGNLGMEVFGTLEFAKTGNYNADYVSKEDKNIIDSGVTATFTEGNLTRTLTNNGTVVMKSGSTLDTYNAKITGGDVSLGSGVEFTSSNFENINTLTLDNAIYNYLN